MLTSLALFVALALGLSSIVSAQFDPALVGTWSTKSKKVLTGPGFYNPVTDRLIEPALTGISYSFTIDGYYEEAIYQAIPNPTTPSCPQGIMQWQHGTYSLPGNGSILLQPFAVDGRQLMSSPCSYDQSVYTRFEQPELFRSYEAGIDPFHNIQQLKLFKFDGSPQNPMWLVYQPPQMLPTSTLNPTSTTVAGQVTNTAKSRARRDMKDSTGEKHKPLNAHNILMPTELWNADRWCLRHLGGVYGVYDVFVKSGRETAETTGYLET